MPSRDARRVRQFRLVLIKPSHYDDDGYVIQWLRSAVPSNTLATLFGLAQDCADRRVLGEDVEIAIDALDETNTRIVPGRLIRQIRRAGSGMVAFVGVQSNQFPRAMDLARPLRRVGIPVCIGGFHVSGCMAMLPELPPDLEEARALGVSLFAGEAEGRLEEVLRDADRGELAPVYDYMSALPDLAGAPVPVLPAERARRVVGSLATFDAGRGCPFQCSFCTIINVQGRTSRRRSADDVEAIVRANLAQGISGFFITDDNFARNRDWEAILDRLIALREREGLSIRLTIQVDTLCHKLPGFVEKSRRAGVRRVFIGLENINTDNLMAANKPQNRIGEYRAMLQAWKDAGVVTYCGYIIGFPADTPESILRDIAVIQHELPIDMLEFFLLTPLPGSADHQKLQAQGVWMDPDMNRYDLEHVTTGHSLMSPEEWQQIYHQAWRAYYTDEHVEVVLRRAAARGISVGKVLLLMLWFYGSTQLEQVHPLQGGYLRRLSRTDRRPGLPIEDPVRFYARYLYRLARTQLSLLALAWRYGRIRRRIKADPQPGEYTDLALRAASPTDREALELFAPRVQVPEPEPEPVPVASAAPPPA